MQRRKMIYTYIAAALVLEALLFGCGAKPAAKPSASASPSAESTPVSTSSPSPSPSPTPTVPPVGTVIDGWVVGIPAYVPRFSYGTIDRSQSKITEGSVGSLFALCITGVTKADLEAYAKTLETAGFTSALAEINTTYTMTASLDGDWTNATLVITLNEQTGVANYSLGVPV